MRIAGAWPVFLATVAASLTLAPGRAAAQHRFGRGYGGFGGYGYYGLGPYYYNQASPESFLYQRSLQNASRATMGPVMHDVYANNPASYIYHLHDPGYLDGYDVATRRRIEATIGRFSDGPPPPEPRRRNPRGPAADAGPRPVAPRPLPAPAEVVPSPPRKKVPQAGRVGPAGDRSTMWDALGGPG